jgi:hypothetical protein
MVFIGNPALPLRGEKFALIPSALLAYGWIAALALVLRLVRQLIQTTRFSFRPWEASPPGELGEQRARKAAQGPPLQGRLSALPLQQVVEDSQAQGASRAAALASVAQAAPRARPGPACPQLRVCPF